MQLFWTEGAQITSAKTVVHGIIAGILTPFPIPNNDACKNMACPVTSGSDVTYNNAIFVQEAYPKVIIALLIFHSNS